MSLSRMITKIYDENVVEDKEKEKINFSTIFWIFFIAGITGIVVETLWCILKYGQLQSRTSLLLLPFNVVYGIGGVLLFLFLRGIKPDKKIAVFLVGMVTGTLVEYVLSFAQEKVFGSVSWDYSSTTLNINGRVCLIYSIFWGFLSILWVNNIFPNIKKIIAKFDNEQGRKFSYIMTAILVILAIISVIAVFRWGQRLGNTSPKTVIGFITDKVFSNGVMTYFYPNMKFL